MATEQELAQRVVALEERIRSLTERVGHMDHTAFTEADGQTLSGRIQVLEKTSFDSSKGARLEEKIADLESTVIRLEKAIEERITKTEFSPIKSIVYGMSAIILIAVLGGLAKLVIR